MMVERVWKWFTLRWPFYPLKHLLLDEEIAGGASYAYTLGSAILAVVSLQIATGIIQVFYYVPSIDHAYDSVNYLRTEVPFGWLIHNLHYWGANIMVVLVALHMVRVFIWGAYKSQLTWLIGIGLLVTTMALTFTGAPLIWDLKGYWAGEVGSSITGTAPVFGGIMKTVLRGGELMGQLTLSRFFAIHVILLVPSLLLLIAVHVASFRTSGIIGPWNREKRKQTGPFWPDQVFKDTVVLTFVIFILISLSVFQPAPFTGPADPSNTTYLPKPEWNFLFLYQSLKYFKGPLEPIGTAGVPTVLLALLALLPAIDRNPERNPARRPIAMFCLAAYAGTILTLTTIGYLSPGYAELPASPAKPTASQSAPQIPQNAATPQAVMNTSEMPGAKLFTSAGCIGCHSIQGKGGTAGPELSGATLKGRDKTWLTHQIRDPKTNNPNTIMPSFTALSEKEINDLADYLLAVSGGAAQTSTKGTAPEGGMHSNPAKAGKNVFPAETPANTPDGPATTSSSELPGTAAFMIGNAENGAILFRERCASCHGQEGRGGVQNTGAEEQSVPTLNPVDSDIFSPDPRTFAKNIDRFVQHGSVPKGAPTIKMPPFGDNNALTQEEIANIEAYVTSLNKVDRAALLDPGMQPLTFFYFAASIFIFVALILGGIWNKKYRHRCE